AALEELGKSKGYTLVGSNTAGHNAFFVRNDVLGPLRAKTAAEAYQKAQFRESRDREGRLTFLDQASALREIGEMPLFDVETGRVSKLRELLT
ncbi:MAG: hypothetical protein HY075_15930, partial [Deltaproteobacteria bacterium]|nr:hypothetical protein [Deltaproteobacteria bacterium]